MVASRHPKSTVGRAPPSTPAKAMLVSPEVGVGNCVMCQTTASRCEARAQTTDRLPARPAAINACCGWRRRHEELQFRFPSTHYCPTVMQRTNVRADRLQGHGSRVLCLGRLRGPPDSLFPSTTGMTATASREVLLLTCGGTGADDAMGTMRQKVDILIWLYCRATACLSPHPLDTALARHQ